MTSTIQVDDMRPGHRACLMSAQGERPTPFRIATEMLAIYPLNEQYLASRPEFATGWEAGVENDLDIGSMPTEFDSGHQLHTGYTKRKAWLLGFISGQWALIHGNDSPFCVFPMHKNECEKANEAAQQAAAQRLTEES